jgi:hypothetical protein
MSPRALPRDVTWYSAPGNSMRSGRAMGRMLRRLTDREGPEPAKGGMRQFKI